jgi:hypothetical protein
MPTADINFNDPNIHSLYPEITPILNGNTQLFYPLLIKEK